MLDYLTLRISDPEISQDYHKTRRDKCNSWFWNIGGFGLIYVVVFCLQYVRSHGDWNIPMRPLVPLITQLVWAIVRKVKPSLSPLIIFLPIILSFTIFQFVLAGKISGEQDPADFIEYEDQFFHILVMTFVFNFNSFLTTVLVVPPLYVGLYFVQQKVELQLQYHIFTGDKLDAQMQEYALSHNVGFMFKIVATLLVQNYIF